MYLLSDGHKLHLHLRNPSPRFSLGSWALPPHRQHSRQHSSQHSSQRSRPRIHHREARPPSRTRSRTRSLRCGSQFPSRWPHSSSSWHSSTASVAETRREGPWRERMSATPRQGRSEKPARPSGTRSFLIAFRFSFVHECEDESISSVDDGCVATS